MINGINYISENILTNLKTINCDELNTELISNDEINKLTMKRSKHVAHHIVFENTHWFAFLRKYNPWPPWMNRHRSRFRLAKYHRSRYPRCLD
mgnify:CR=1 FL=1